MGILSGLCSSLTKAISSKYTKSSGSSNSNKYAGEEYLSKDNNPFAGDHPENCVYSYENNLIRGNSKPVSDKVKHNNIPSREAATMETNFDIAAWGYKDFINERVSWQKGLDSLFGEPSWFYFKIFFKFDSTFGLLGGILGGNNDGYISNNTAYRYLSRIAGYPRYKSENLNERQRALERFVKTLSWISCTTPWFFKGVKDVQTSIVMDFDNLTKEKAIEIECSEEATDMRLMTLMDLYKFVAYDEIHQKEILPENLRKFDMDIVVFQSPLRYFHTSLKNLKNKTTKYKTLNSTDMTDRMSFKLITFQNCEIDYNSLTTFLPSSMDNSSAFGLKPTFKIKYERAYQHISNEFANLIVGTKGFYGFWSQNGEQHKRIDMLKYAIDNKRYYNSASSVYKALVDASEDTITNAMRTISAETALGNIYGNYGVNSDYGKSKIKHQKDGTYKIDYSNVDSTSVVGAFKDTISAFGTGYKNWFKNTIGSFTEGWSSGSNKGNMNPTLFSRDSNKNELAGQYNIGNYGVKSKSSYAKNGYKKEDKEVDWTSAMTLKGKTPKEQVEHHQI